MFLHFDSVFFTDFNPLFWTGKRTWRLLKKKTPALVGARTLLSLQRTWTGCLLCSVECSNYAFTRVPGGNHQPRLRNSDTDAFPSPVSGLGDFVYVCEIRGFFGTTLTRKAAKVKGPPPSPTPSLTVCFDWCRGCATSGSMRKGSSIQSQFIPFTWKNQ